jgi:hypothetical protein
MIARHQHDFNVVLINDNFMARCADRFEYACRVCDQVRCAEVSTFI